ncbi:hypothetical protein F4778DRAFT_780846 [Xylariomycetidae sp. FL2044]|nr:hypothetical protein F4778DRAFT_780846 [Xylariomycetidae sp. FL2044]
MSVETQPITAARFAEALKELPASSLALKVLELRNSIAHLDYSNAELKPYAEGREPTIEQTQQQGSSTTTTTTTTTTSARPDQDCIDAIAENEAVIARMQERIDLIRIEVEDRGLSWREFQGKPDDDNDNREAMTRGPSDDSDEAAASGSVGAAAATGGGGGGGGVTNGVNGHVHGSGQQQQHEAWRDGTFQTGTIRGNMTDEELLRQLQSRMPPENDDDDGDDGPEGGMHL